jgi:hypothetical protein
MESNADMVELADAVDSKSATFGCGGSNPSIGTNERERDEMLQVQQRSRHKTRGESESVSSA